jgi:predicted secreted protein
MIRSVTPQKITKENEHLATQTTKSAPNFSHSRARMFLNTTIISATVSSRESTAKDL